MVGIVRTYTTIGIDGQQLTVECDATSQVFAVTIVGMASNAVKESQDRIFAALRNSGWDAAVRRFTINLAPADIRKDSAALDLPIAIAVLQSIKQIPVEYLTKTALIGELSLDGNLRPVKGVLPIALAAKRDGIDTLVLPWENAGEAAIIEGLQVIPVTSLKEAALFLRGEAKIPPAEVDREQIFFLPERLSRGYARREGAVSGQARPGGLRRRRPQPADAGPSRLG